MPSIVARHNRVEMDDIENYQELAHCARAEKRKLDVAITMCPVLYASAAFVVLAAALLWFAHSDRSAAEAQRLADNDAYYRLAEGEKALLSYGFQYGQDHSSIYFLLTAPGTRAYTSRCDGVLCVRIYAVPK